MVKRNTIIILGNGFDIANGLPTKYSDFANFQLNKIGNKLVEDVYDSSISESFKKFHKHYLLTGQPIANNVNKRILVKLVRLMSEKNHDKVITFLESNLEYLSSIISNSFLARLFSNNYVNWFDIENAYFEELIKIEQDIFNYLQGVKQNTSRRTSGELSSFIDAKRIELQKLNNELQQIKNELKLYLKSLNITQSKNIKEFFSNNFKRQKSSIPIHFINFNYTNTIEMYTDILSNHGYIVNVLNIHGTINEDIIFGYGNDQNKDYQIMNEMEIDEFLENFKTFEYLNKNRYSTLFKRILPSMSKYDVFVIGHSLGQTDKTLLSGILNNNNCQEIQLFKRGDLDDENSHKAYRKQTFALSRIISNEYDSLRLKVIDFDNIKTFP